MIGQVSQHSETDVVDAIQLLLVLMAVTVGQWKRERERER
jgi:hypothetical protein